MTLTDIHQRVLRDDELSAIFDEAEQYDPEFDYESVARVALQERLERDEDRTLAWIARRLGGLIERQDALQRQRDATLEHFRTAEEPIVRQIEGFNDAIEGVLRARRERNPEVKTLTLLGIGEWKSRKVSDGWNIDEKTTLEKLSPDEAARWVEQRPHLKTSEVRAHLDGLLTPAKQSLPADASPEEREERLRDITNAIAEQYGVEYRPERISVKGPLS